MSTRCEVCGFPLTQEGEIFERHCDTEANGGCHRNPHIVEMPERTEDGITGLLRELGLPRTRENHLLINFLGQVPEEIDPEIEEEIPEDLRLKSYRNKKKTAW